MLANISPEVYDGQKALQPMWCGVLFCVLVFVSLGLLAFLNSNFVSTELFHLVMLIYHQDGGNNLI